MMPTLLTIQDFDPATLAQPGVPDLLAANAGGTAYTGTLSTIMQNCLTDGVGDHYSLTAASSVADITDAIIGCSDTRTVTQCVTVCVNTDMQEMSATMNSTMVDGATAVR